MRAPSGGRRGDAVMTMMFGAIGRNFWPFILLLVVATAAVVFLRWWQGFALLLCCVGALLMWESERHDPPRAAPAE